MTSMFAQQTEAELHVEKDFSTKVMPTRAVFAPTAKPKLDGFKLAVIGAYFIGMIGLMGGLYTYYSLLLEAKQRKALEANHAALSDRTIALESQIEDQKSAVTKLDQKLSTALTKEEAMRYEIRREIEKRRLEIFNLQKKMNHVEDQLLSSSQMAVAMTSAGEDTSTVVTAQAMTESPAVSVSTAPAPAAASATRTANLSGKDRVLTVNRQFKFVVINMGAEEGVKVGDKFNVLRDGSSIATVQIEKLYDNFSAATIVQESGGDAAIEVGDGIAKV